MRGTGGKAVGDPRMHQGCKYHEHYVEGTEPCPNGRNKSWGEKEILEVRRKQREE